MAKLVLFTLFLIYPTVSAEVLAMYVCIYVEDADGNNRPYIERDFRLVCYDSQWRSYLGINIIFIIIYPLGMPSIFLYLLNHFRSNIWCVVHVFVLSFEAINDDVMLNHPSLTSSRSTTCAQIPALTIKARSEK